MDDEADRSKKLLSADAVPEIQVPDSAPIVAPTFRLPSVLGKPAAPDKPAAPVVAPTTDGDGAAGKQPPRRKRPSTGRFRDRTLNWFKTGDELDPGAPASTGEYEPDDAPRPRWLIPAIVGGVMFAAAIAFLALS